MSALSRIVPLLLAAGIGFGAPGAAEPWRIESGTRLEVDVAWGGAKVVVRFPDLAGEVDFDPDRPDLARALIVARAAAATTGLPPADALLRGPGYLDARRFPSVEFRLDRLVQTSRSTADVFGRLTLRGVTREVRFEARALRYGPVSGEPDRFEAGFDIRGRIDRTEYGSTAGLPEVPAVMPVRVRLLMSSLPP
jgi:polyisoprenoid-binding protein YceI